MYKKDFFSPEFLFLRHIFSDFYFYLKYTDGYLLLHILIFYIFYLISDLTLSRFYRYLIRGQFKFTKSENCSTSQMRYSNEKIKHGLFCWSAANGHLRLPEHNESIYILLTVSMEKGSKNVAKRENLR